MPCAVCRVPCVCGGVAQVRVCHRCLYGREYNRKNEMQYLSWIKAESLYTSEGYKNFRSQPDKQKVIDDYAAGAPAAQANGVAVVGAGGAPAAAARAGAVPVVGQALLGELAGQYRKCAACQKILQKCQCEGPKTWRAHSGLTPRGGGTGAGAGGAGGGGLAYGRSGSGGSLDDVCAHSSSDSGTALRWLPPLSPLATAPASFCRRAAHAAAVLALAPADGRVSSSLLLLPPWSPHPSSPAPPPARHARNGPQHQ